MSTEYTDLGMRTLRLVRHRSLSLDCGLFGTHLMPCSASPLSALRAPGPMSIDTVVAAKASSYLSLSPTGSRNSRVCSSSRDAVIGALDTHVAIQIG